MQTIELGRSGLKVTPICFGTWEFSGEWGALAGPEHPVGGDRRRAPRPRRGGQDPPYRRVELPRLAVAWVLAQPGVDCAIVGASSPAHLEESVGAVRVLLSDDDLATIDRILQSAAPVVGPSPEGQPDRA